MNFANPIDFFSAKKVNEGLNFLEPIKRVLDSNWFILGEEVREFEREFAMYIGTSFCVGVANGSEALEIALRALNIKATDKVVIVANAGFYGSTAVHAVGAEPLYIEINKFTLTMDPEAFEAVIETKPSAVIVTHLYGQMADISFIKSLASSAGIPVIEDCAQSHGARHQGKLAGSFGDISCFSFYPTKNLGALGDGGAVLTSSTELAERLRKLRQYGWSQKYHVSVPDGRNSRLDEMQAAILRLKLPNLDNQNNARKLIAERYNTAFGKLDIKLPVSMGADYVAHLYVIQTPHRAALAKALKLKGIATDIHYPVADHLQDAYKCNPVPSLPVTELACQQVISLPCYPGLSIDEVSYVIACVTEFFGRGC